MFDPVFSDPLLLLSPINPLIEQSLGGKLYILSFVCIAVSFGGFFLDSAVQTEGQSG
ncbi:unnamed protein product [Staurois parvus]|uniref:Uncharacterized protein n=1 Tax=Staurois parvus TaxID=386267 RepID=A0ABN9EWC7_9NEOB|nr:unnamed protein product [Staurois parvus]